MVAKKQRKSAGDEDEVRFFATLEDWRAWLEEHHDKRQVQWVGFHKRGTGKPSITWPESVAGALCYGWIDGLRRGIDENTYRIRFTPRKAGSTWSAVNVKRVAALMEQGLMRPAGLAAFEARTPNNPGIYSYEQRDQATFQPEFEARFRANAKAWSYWEKQPPWYRKTATYWVVSAKQEATRERRMAMLIADSEKAQPIGPLRRPSG
jgi:uncharacterized protein YdeI (YjbR/CyaY-like superfamily)